MSVREAADEINEVEGAGKISKSSAQRWFSRSESGDLDLEDKPRSGRPTKLNDEDLLQVLEDEPSSSSRELASELDVDHTTILRHLHQLDFVHKKRRFESFDEIEETCQEFFDSKPKEWYFDQIRKLADRWQKVVENDGLYFEE